MQGDSLGARDLAGNTLVRQLSGREVTMAATSFDLRSESVGLKRILQGPPWA